MRLTIELNNLSELEKVIQLLQSLQIKEVKVLPIVNAVETPVSSQNDTTAKINEEEKQFKDGKGILQFAGVMSDEEAAEMYDALADTENIDKDGW